MKLAIFVLIASHAVATPALAQRADCPPSGAPLPTAPPGEPPPFLPKVQFPQKFGDPIDVPKTGELPRSSFTQQELEAIDERAAKHRANDDLLDAEDGHVASLVHLARNAVAAVPPPHDTFLVDVSKSPLASWKLLGYMPEASTNRISRFFKSAEGSLVHLQEWDFRADGGAVQTLPGLKMVRIGKHDASVGGVRGPSGCTRASIAWHDERKLYVLDIVGPLPLSGQRAALLEIATALAAAADRWR